MIARAKNTEYSALVVGSNGWKVLSGHLAIQACAVVGEPDSIREEAVITYLKLYEGHQVEAEELREFCAKDLSYFKVRRSSTLSPIFPRTSIGKIQKNLLRGK
ncbi:acyl-coenzyme A synthetase/AMP-(fatty) acid ligase [Planomicrobium stackebrandtii]|uniref:Acyl-coenzyme A synthetase/AMP-(Fatty) acid ligase n=1 Tax=Planomicrobium stackebrandtii TaxID=253160 RepID=A0ABU0GUP0_9BACL|nr:hypothetical protein [Planomicrobium stackebrandtii]MDQ0428798.1 acyl-coenzyme A synthetase/AMP-(fatty) acid ligase [Planomicrobium stackebrandtii]